MTTIGENMLAMATLARQIKDETRLSEQTVLRIMDMTLAMAQAMPPMDEADEAPSPTPPEEAE